MNITAPSVARRSIDFVLLLLVGALVGGLLLEILRVYEVEAEVRDVWAGVAGGFTHDVVRTFATRRAS